MEKGKKMDIAMRNGMELRAALKDERSLSEINAIGYRFLHALKNNDRVMFFDRYYRFAMEYNISSVLEADEISDIDAFHNFGYGFIAGFLKEKSEADDSD